jgi:phage replication O-like protein O
MENPQLEDGYTRIANKLFEAALCFPFKGRQEVIVFFAVIRKTYGFQKKKDEISYGQLSELTGIERRTVIRIVKSLVGYRTLGVSDSGSQPTRKPRSIWINKDFSQWLAPTSGSQPTMSDSGSQPTRNSGSQPTRNSGSQPTHKRKKEIKESPPFINPPLGEFQNVKLTPIELEKLYNGFGEDEAKERIENLSEGIASKGYRYKSHYATILSWARKEGKRPLNKKRERTIFDMTDEEINERERKIKEAENGNHKNIEGTAGSDE